MPMTRDGLLTALESLVEQPLQIGLYTNTPDGDVVSVSDLEEARNYKRVTVPKGGWKIDRDALTATCEKVSIRFTGRGGKIVGYFIEGRGRVVLYEPFMDPVPANSDEDVIGVRARIDAQSLAS